MSRQESGLGVDAVGEKIFNQKVHGPVGVHGFNWGSVLDPLRKRFLDAGNFYRAHDEDQEDSSEEDSSEEEESSSSEDFSMGEYNSSDTTVNGPCAKGRK